jgi:hypothetical protein
MNSALVSLTLHRLLFSLHFGYFGYFVRLIKYKA